jgi:hypothetical protein
MKAHLHFYIVTGGSQWSHSSHWGVSRGSLIPANHNHRFSLCCVAFFLSFDSQGGVVGVEIFEIFVRGDDLW